MFPDTHAKVNDVPESPRQVNAYIATAVRLTGVSAKTLDDMTTSIGLSWVST